jgi:hypothetical protein
LTWRNLLTLEQLQQLSDEEITRRVSDLIAPKQVTENPFYAQPADFVAAQFYLSELDRREKRRADDARDKAETTRRRVDLALELLIILLIGIEIVLAILSGYQQSKEAARQLKAFTDMQAVLSNLQQTSQATANTMAMLETTTETMSGLIQKQVALFYDVEITVAYVDSGRKILLQNQGRTKRSDLGHALRERRQTSFLRRRPHNSWSGRQL